MIPVAMPFLDEAEADAAYQAVLSGWVSQGPQVAAFEREFAASAGALHACAVSNCTTALHLSLLAVGVGPGDEVITGSHSFIATANSIRYCGATPVFVDIDPRTYNIDPQLVAEAVTGRTRAILAIHQMGMPCDLHALMAVASRHNVALIEDAACAVGSQIWADGRWERIGKPHGKVACFSFHPRKVITTGEGGMLTTSNPECDSKFRLCRQHGMSIPDTVRHGSQQVIFEDYLVLGFNYRMTDIQAAVGRKQLERLPEIVSRRRALAARYDELLGDIEGLGFAVRTRLGTFQLAELLRAVARPGRSESRDAEPSRPRYCNTARDYVLAPRGALFGGQAASSAAQVRTCAGSLDRAPHLRTDARGRPRSSDRCA